MFFMDFETTTSKISTDYSRVWLWGIKGALKGDKLSWGITMEDFFETIKREDIKEGYFHNLKFDGNYIFKWMLKNGIKFRNIDENNEKLPENHFEWINDDKGNLYIMHINYKGHVFRLMDSWKVLMASVEDLGESIGLEKLDIDYHAYNVYERKEDVPKEAIRYLERDIDVVIETFTKAIGLYNKKITRASMAYEDFREYYNNTNESQRQFSIDFGGKVWDYREKKFVWKNMLTKEEWKTVNKSYQGGYTNWNQNYTNVLLENIDGVSYDVNSLYPSVMMNYKMPYGRPLYSKPLSGEYVTLRRILIQKAKLKDPSTPPFIKKKGGKYREAKYLSEVDYEEYVYWDEEFEFIKKYYDVTYVEIGNPMYFRVKWVFKDWLEEKKELKINATDELERNFHKGIYNSSYGKFAQNIRMGSRIIVEDGNYVKYIKGERYLFNRETRQKVRKLASNVIRYGNFGEYKHEAYFKETDQYKYIPIASYITMKSRMILFDAMYKNLDIWLYSDTDSCYFSGEPKGIDIHESRFGAWKAEHKFNKFKVLRAKAYMLFSTYAWKKGGWQKHNKIVKKISGLSKSGKEKVNFENFYLGSIIKEGKRGLINVDDGMLIVDKDFTLGEEIKL